MDDSGIAAVDWVVLAIVSVAVLRGLAIGLIRESFSIAALGGAVLAVRLFTAPAAQWLLARSEGSLGPNSARWIAATLLALGVLIAVGIAGRWIRRGARAVGLGWADRLGGGALGAAEGALLAALLVLGATWLIGRDHPALVGSRSVETFEDIRSVVQQRSNELPSVAAPPRDRFRSDPR